MMPQLASLLLLPVPLWFFCLFFSPMHLHSPWSCSEFTSLEAEICPWILLDLLCKVFIFCNADTKLLSLMFPQAVCWLKQRVGRFLGEVSLPSLTPPEVWREHQGVQKIGSGGVWRGEKQLSSALATGTATACCFMGLDVNSCGYLLLMKRKPKRT